MQGCTHGHALALRVAVVVKLRLEVHASHVSCVAFLDDAGRNSPLHRMIFNHGSFQPPAL